MFTESNWFAEDLQELCFQHDLATALLDCTSSGSVDDAVAHLRERLAEHWNPSDDLLKQVCQETGAWDDLDSVDRTTLIDRAIFCSLPDPLDSSEFIAALARSIYSKIEYGSDAREFIYKLAQTHDDL